MEKPTVMVRGYVQKPKDLVGGEALGKHQQSTFCRPVDGLREHGIGFPASDVFVYDADLYQKLVEAHAALESLWGQASPYVPPDPQPAQGRSEGRQT